MLFGNVLADRHKAQAMPVQAAEDRVVARAPGQETVCLTGDSFDDWADAAAKLERVASHKAARPVGLVELLAPQTERYCPVAVGFLADVSVDVSIRMEHQVLADQAARIGKPIGEPPGGRIE